MQKRLAALLAVGVLSVLLASLLVSAFWPFSLTGRVIDDYSQPAFTMAGNSKANVLGSGSVASEGVDGNSLSFDGKSGYYMMKASSWNGPVPEKAVSVTGWFKTGAFTTGANEITGSWVSKRNSYNLDAEADGRVIFWVFLDGQWHSVSSNKPGDVSLNMWEHWVGTWDGNTISLYKNGALLAQAAASGKLGNTGDLCIGHDCALPAPHDNRYFQGLADEVRVYSNALSAGAVKSLYTEQKGKLTTGSSGSNLSTGGSGGSGGGGGGGGSNTTSGGSGGGGTSNSKSWADVQFVANTEESVNLYTDNYKIFEGDYLYNVKSIITSSDLPKFLASGSVGNQNNYLQHISINPFAKYSLITRDLAGHPDGLGIAHFSRYDSPIYNFTITFTNEVDFTRLKGQQITMFGKTFLIGENTKPYQLELIENNNYYYLGLVSEEITTRYSGGITTGKDRLGYGGVLSAVHFNVDSSEKPGQMFTKVKRLTFLFVARHSTDNVIWEGEEYKDPIFGSGIFFKRIVVPSGGSGGGGGGSGGSGGGGSGSTGSTNAFCASTGCIIDGGKCVPFGTRVAANYCALDGKMKAQAVSDVTCGNNYECSSNVCAGGKCVDAGLMQKILDWFKKLFGG